MAINEKAFNTQVKIKRRSFPPSSDVVATATEISERDSANGREFVVVDWRVDKVISGDVVVGGEYVSFFDQANSKFKDPVTGEKKEGLGVQNMLRCFKGLGYPALSKAIFNEIQQAAKEGKLKCRIQSTEANKKGYPSDVHYLPL